MLSAMYLDLCCCETLEHVHGSYLIADFVFTFDLIASYWLPLQFVSFQFVVNHLKDSLDIYLPENKKPQGNRCFPAVRLLSVNSTLFGQLR